MHTQMLVSCHMNFTISSRREPRGGINPNFTTRNKPLLNVFYVLLKSNLVILLVYCRRTFIVTIAGEVKGENL